MVSITAPSLLLLSALQALLALVPTSDVDTADLSGFDALILQGDVRDELGYSVSGAGDVNGDGLADMIVSSYKTDPNGRTDAGMIRRGKRW
jgi:hypothetical protein